MAAISSGGLNELCTDATRKDPKAVKRVLFGIHGIGPQVAQNVWMLLQEEGEK
jgi:hypothetical protein